MIHNYWLEKLTGCTDKPTAEGWDPPRVVNPTILIMKDPQRNSMALWKTTLEVNFKPIAQVGITCGIYQGDALSLLLFCIGLNPLS
ncbi:hypothetical protein L3Q82_016595 [Scortum barcoo]|uniref:Uncharacterized protein n=1 Tax=Scortum barcoo TaxID=214431 RepID=A0ACB8X8K8_9TELE|nr:hypothetical protein L3Q82_016595 [Scortum barcoo]